MISTLYFGCTAETPRKYVCPGGASFAFSQSRAIWGEYPYELDAKKGNVRYYKRTGDPEAGLQFDEVSERIYVTVYKDNKLLPGAYWIEDCKRVAE